MGGGGGGGGKPTNECEASIITLLIVLVHALN